MLKIGEFSKLSMLTIKALRLYEKEGLLLPAKVDPWSGYRFYETTQLEAAARIKALRQLDFSLEEIRQHLNGLPLRDALGRKERELLEKQTELAVRLSIIQRLLEENEMKYQAVLKEIPETVVYSEERMLEHYRDVGTLVLESAEECIRLNPDVECVKPDYGFCEQLDGEYRETGMRTRYSQAVVKAGVGNERIQFRTLPATRAICIYHKGAYDLLGDAYAYIMKYAADHGYTPAGFVRECYIDGVWNRERVEDWLTEVQLPIKE